MAKSWKTYSTQSSSVKTKATTALALLPEPTTSEWRPLPETSLSLSERLSRIGGKRILWVDLNEVKYGQGEVVHYSVDTNLFKMNWHRLNEVLIEIRKLEMMNSLKQFIEADARKPPSGRIDSVQWNVETG